MLALLLNLGFAGGGDAGTVFKVINVVSNKVIDKTRDNS